MRDDTFDRTWRYSSNGNASSKTHPAGCNRDEEVETTYLLSQEAEAIEPASEDEAARRQREMQEWQQDWQLMGRWLMSGAARQQELNQEARKADDLPPTGEENRPQDTCSVTDRARADRTLERSQSSPSGGSLLPSERQLEKRGSLRVRMQRRVSDGYVLALKTVAAVRRVGRDRDSSHSSPGVS